MNRSSAGGERINLLWTGGWDSTYRMLELSFQEVTVHPVYVIDPGRGSTQREIAAIHAITKALREKERTRATIDEAEIRQLSSIPPDAAITGAYSRIVKSIRLGTQYEWLGRLARVYPFLEIGVEKPHGEFSGCNTVIERMGKWKEGADVLDPDGTDKDCFELLGWFTFPIIRRTELEMAEKIREWGYEDIMRMIWFCYDPIRGQPCGLCRPCQQKMESSMEWLLPPQAQKRYYRAGRLRKLPGGKAAALYTLAVRYFAGGRSRHESV